MREANLALRGARGFAEGVFVDTMMWAMTAYFPGLAKPTPLRVPGYVSSGMHWDDLLSLGTSLAVSVYGAFKRSAGTVVEGLGMAAGAFVISRHQTGPAQKLW